MHIRKNMNEEHTFGSNCLPTIGFPDVHILKTKLGEKGESKKGHSEADFDFSKIHYEANRDVIKRDMVCG